MIYITGSTDRCYICHAERNNREIHFARKQVGLCVSLCKDCRMELVRRIMMEEKADAPDINAGRIGDEEPKE